MMKFLTRYTRWVMAGVAVVGIVLIAWAAFVDSPWFQGLLVNVGTSFLLLVPLLFLNQILTEKVEVLDRELRGRVQGLAALKEALPSGPTRTSMIDALLESARRSAAAGEVTEAEFEQLARGDEFGRTVALATMLGTPKLFADDLVVRGVVWSDSANEQFYALKVAEDSWDRLDSEAQDQIVKCLAGDSRAGRRIRHSNSRRAVAERIQIRARREAAVG